MNTNYNLTTQTSCQNSDFDLILSLAVNHQIPHYEKYITDRETEIRELTNQKILTLRQSVDFISSCMDFYRCATLNRKICDANFRLSSSKPIKIKILLSKILNYYRENYNLHLHNTVSYSIIGVGVSRNNGGPYFFLNEIDRAKYIFRRSLTPYTIIQMWNGNFEGYWQERKIGIDLSKRFPTDGSTLLINAIYSLIEPPQKVLEDLISGSPIDAQENFYGVTALIEAVYRNYNRSVQLLIKHKANIHLTDISGRNALHVTAIRDNIQLCELLLKSNAEVDSLDINKVTSLMWASVNSSEEMVKLLIESKAQVNLQDGKGFTTLIYACQYGRLNNMKLLIQSRAQLELSNNCGATPLIAATLNGNLEGVNLLIQANAQINVVNSVSTPLIEACRIGYSNVVDLLIQNKAELNSINSSGLTALLAASLAGHPSIVNSLIQAKAQVNLQEKDTGFSPLIAACQNNHFHVVKILIQARAWLDTKNKDGYTALMMAKEKRHTEIANLLIQAENAHQPPNEEKKEV